jgi:hypothetical protein
MNDDIRQPGPWLDEELTQAESAEIVEYAEVSAKLKGETDHDVIIETIAPYLNTVMHLLYLLIRGKMGLKTTEDGVIDDEGRPFDLVGAVVDFIESGNDALTLPNIITANIKDLDFPLDKVNRKIWGLIERNTGGQIGIGTERIGSDKQVTILYSIDFDNLPEGLTITKALEPFDKRVYMAMAALYKAKKTTSPYVDMTYTEIYHAMGYTGRPGTADLEKLDKAITKMFTAHVYLNNADEIRAKYKYPHFKYDGSLLPMERVRAMANGKIVESAIRLFREPPLMTFARDRKQLTTIPKKLLQSPLSKTDANIRLEDVLIEEITGVKRKRRSNRFLYETIYQMTGTTSKMQRQRAPEKIRKLLQHYKACGFIERYSMDKDGFTVFYGSGNQNPQP